MANTDLSALLKSEAIRAVLRAPNRKVTRAVVRTNPLKNIRSMLQLNPYAAVLKKNAELLKAKNLRAKVGSKIIHDYHRNTVEIIDNHGISV
jgi:large subunit ribosomal protein L4e